MSDGNREDRAQDLLAEHLRAREASIDCEALARRVAARLRAERPQRVRMLSRPIVRVAAALLIAVGLFALFSRHGGSGDAYAATREIVTASRTAGDCTYRVTVSSWAGPLARLFSGCAIELHTRGDRFFARPERGDVDVAWGSRELGKDRWIAVRGHFGLEGFVGAEHPVLDDFRSMDLRRVLEDLLDGFDLSLSHDGDVDVIDATRRAGATDRVALHVKLWAKTDRLVVERLQVTFPSGAIEATLEDESPNPDEAYTPAGHLGPNDPVFTGAAAALRLPLLLKLLTH
ncbi:MAG: hypothetical protein HYR85_05275 [Planctomycetes bacterium]|nr:hypothetical protein [Planctomycetota bacterium]MBI3846157.1 hypothetical protein [Planctomycetota bacterium]